MREIRCLYASMTAVAATRWAVVILRHSGQASFAASERRYVTELETTEWSVRTSLIAQLARLVLFHDALVVATRPLPPPDRAAAAAAAPPPPYTFDRVVPLNAVHILEPDGTCAPP